jgi:hypothetical protein
MSEEEDDDGMIGGDFNPLNWFHINPFDDKDFFELPSISLKNFIIAALIITGLILFLTNFKFTRKF